MLFRDSNEPDRVLTRNPNDSLNMSNASESEDDVQRSSFTIECSFCGTAGGSLPFPAAGCGFSPQNDANLCVTQVENAPAVLKLTECSQDKGGIFFSFFF
ncbi:hypothetical protein E1B28_006554 [Marasmius oreades]|uniref:Uncharacterized protein n=1 Tax=Marasmius oreades TaxID=181124 RepID=A0A9P7S5T8_9AGAR|nr:uncharacterized protein E1B28_006554 [Marasmius oreades]KAG7095862.1 hypothetical protein E1B28_006554 [Marasmius oreades]